ncbi:L,D-transpeptidase [Clostridium saccharobutylicum]|uniref:Putative L,D-transpeptidase YciB n=2 Tax=Clostridium saccharobutylicum TaxID=169679 RepID=U5MJW5_CLOSA|nr:L,D-transpeptidase [Clostridium saccharobutylicum]AGX41099.1 putative L,D-transpeptidase YciB [Clostridium saccharobutylicum DSM 13864]AQR88385.1 putative L,D-transpeptidase YciB precursor [Clostridium saccharobutylicum]AQR98283.1 putative L,D-transpeptidase YciB precursor [Clostridium saccharobutylicum]AQS12273.1 putative L,D-transpeptidase YciB precursor [Clostridium saccharobutylicum]MBA2906085.1 lipoprotein-anchoring transpeptidase ErfK/SrfK [Clostridium saccharobutylicum]
MKLYKNLYHNKLKYKKKFKITLLVFLFLITLTLSAIYEAYRYTKLINEFKTDFDNYKFSEANNLLLTKQISNPFKSYMLMNDLHKYFNAKTNTISDNINNKSISSENALTQLKEIARYDIIPHEDLLNISESIDLNQDSNNNFNNGITAFNNGQYAQAISAFKKVSSLDLNYEDSLKYLGDSKDKLKQDLLDRCDDLASNDYYTQALSLISNNSDILGDDSDIQEKIATIKEQQQEYLNKASAASEASSRALTTAISQNNINTLNIESTTSYFIDVDLKNQKTYIYKGTADNWQLIKSFPCSTGITGEDTPTGSFSIKEKGDWFFSDKYKQGGKYWTQITGDILFHSSPFAKDKTTIVDYTLNKPSSHGCIRLSIDDAKWIYTNIPKGSKVIIK